MVINDTYYRACDLAQRLHPTAPTDLVHDTFVAWYDKTKENIFDEPESIVMIMVKKMFNKKYRQKALVRFTDRLRQTLVTPEDELIEREMGLTFLSFDEVSQHIISYEQYHRIYPKIHEN